MNPFKVDIASPEEEDQYIAKFLKILSSLGEHASSYLFQKGVVLGDQSYMDFNRQLSDSKFRESVVNSLLRPAEKPADQDTHCLVAILLFNMSKEAAQLLQDIVARPTKTGASSNIIVLGHLLALIDRATAFLHLPSVNDKSYWRLMTLPTPAQIPAAVPSGNQSAPVAPAKQIPPAPEPPKPSNLPRTLPPRPTIIVSKPAVSPASREESKPVPPPAPPKPAVPAVKPVARASQPAVRDKPPTPSKKAPVKKAVKPEPVIEEESLSDSNKPEGPIKAMLRRIAEEIKDNSYEAVIEAIKNETLMKDLYNTDKDPISVKVTEVNTKERIVYLIKQKRGAPEPVTFRLIRKLLTELQ